MKKIAILTFSRAYNYGAVLQAYALKQALTAIGATAGVLNYICHAIDTSYQPFSLGRNRSLFGIVRHLTLLPWRFRRFLKFSDFQKKYLKLGAKIHKKDLATIESAYDVFITGSDQVWNPEITLNDSSFFLDFVKNPSKKSSYAASFGKDCIRNEDKNFIAPLLADFNNISVREACGAEIVKRLIGRYAYEVLDPTLLLTAKEWKKIVVYPKRRKYVFMYLLSRNPKTVDFAKELAKKKDLDLIDITSVRSKILGRILSPQEFIGYIFNAEYIVTNSFHGTLFSINFNKEFFVDLLPPPANVNSRLENIISLTELEHRLIDNVEKCGVLPVEWDKVNNIIEKERETSLDYLKEIVKVV